SCCQPGRSAKLTGRYQGAAPLAGGSALDSAAVFGAAFAAAAGLDISVTFAGVAVVTFEGAAVRAFKTLTFQGLSSLPPNPVSACPPAATTTAPTASIAIATR